MNVEICVEQELPITIYGHYLRSSLTVLPIVAVRLCFETAKPEQPLETRVTSDREG